MERHHKSTRTVARGEAPLGKARHLQRNIPGSSLIVGAKTLAGIGIGLVAVITGAIVVGAATEAVLIPSLLLKLAGGAAGGGVGMAKGLKDARKMNKE